ncbi:hypothetical protein FocTR4_00014271, partial [Fusarium oxysporum f. sp. cubense]
MADTETLARSTAPASKHLLEDDGLHVRDLSIPHRPTILCWHVTNKLAIIASPCAGNHDAGLIHTHWGIAATFFGLDSTAHARTPKPRAAFNTSILDASFCGSITATSSLIGPVEKAADLRRTYA